MELISELYGASQNPLDKIPPDIITKNFKNKKNNNIINNNIQDKSPTATKEHYYSTLICQGDFVRWD